PSNTSPHPTPADARSPPQDWLLIVQALDECAAKLTYVDREPPCATRARVLADQLATEHDFLRDALDTQLDPTWRGPTDTR
uniref:hypothetical protein n=1 Tax=Halorhabdus rudnickae TaxID=1775544 RepID=UPI001082DEF0